MDLLLSVDATTKALPAAVVTANQGTTAGTFAAGNDARINGPAIFATGEATYDPDLAVTAYALVSQRLLLSYFTARRTEAIASLGAVTGNTAAGATPTLCRMGLYSVAGNGDLTLVASCANDTALFAGTNTRYVRAVTQVGVTKTAGQRYAFAALVVSGATMPNLYGRQPFGSVGAWPDTATRTKGRVASQADLPATILAASVTVEGTAIYGEVL